MMRARSLIATTLLLSACAGSDASKAPVKSATDEIAKSNGTGEHFESTRGQFTLELPAFWKGQYRAVERTDSTAGARMSVEFVFTPPPGSGDPEATLFVVRVFPSKAWSEVKARPGPSMAIEAGSRGDDVFGLSFSTTNPYRVGTSTAAKFDSLMLSAMRGPPAVRLTAK
jgi:hypothetical protein